MTERKRRQIRSRGRELPVSASLHRLLELFATGERPPSPSTPICASSVVLVRDTPAGVQVFVTRASDARGIEDRNRWSFPYGEMNPVDVRRLPISGWSIGKCATLLRMDSATRAISHFAAAARVALENLGIVLAADADGEVVVDTELPQLDGSRRALAEGQVQLPQLLRARDLSLRTDLLRPWLRWINTPWQLRRYDMVYFLVAAPAGQVVEFASPNDSWGGWMLPQDVLASAGESGSDHISASARLVCESLAALPTIGAAMAKVRDLRPFEPEVVRHDGAWWLSVDRRADPSERGRVRDEELLANTAGDVDADSRPLMAGSRFEPVGPAEDTEE